MDIELYKSIIHDNQKKIKHLYEIYGADELPSATTAIKKESKYGSVLAERSFRSLQSGIRLGSTYLVGRQQRFSWLSLRRWKWYRWLLTSSGVIK